MTRRTVVPFLQRIVFSPWATAIDSVVDAVSVPWVAVIVYVAAPLTAVGVPEMTPVLALSESPAGRAGATVYVGVSKPVAVIAVVGVIARPVVPDTVCVAGVSEATEMLKVIVA